MLTDVSRLLRRRFDERVRSLGVTRPQWRMLTTLSRNQGTLADLLEAEPITRYRMIDRLEQGGLVERRRDPAVQQRLNDALSLLRDHLLTPLESDQAAHG